MKTVIQRCPICPTIRKHTDEIVSALERDMDVAATVEDGEPGEFSVFVDEVPMIRRDSDTLPSVEEVEAAVDNATPVLT